MKTNTQKKDDELAKDQAKCQLESIYEMVENLDSEDDNKREEALGTIQEDPLEVSVRAGWHTPGQKAEDEEYLILLCTGGPAVRIIGDLNQYNEPESAKLQYQDWFTAWENYPLTDEDEEAVLKYARSFYFGE